MGETDTLRRNGNEVQSETVSAEVLNLTLVQAGDGTMSIKAKQPFSGCEIKFLTVLGVDVGTMGIHYGFVRLSPDIDHHCPIEPSMSTNLCESQSSFSLWSNPKVSVTWRLTEAYDLEGNDILATTKVSVNEDGYVRNLAPGRYTFTATASDGCSDMTTLTVGDFGEASTCGKPMANNAASGDAYALTDDLHGSSGCRYYLYFGDKAAGDNGVKEIDSSSDTTDNIQHEYTTKKAGEYQPIIYDGSGTPLASRLGASRTARAE